MRAACRACGFRVDVFDGLCVVCRTCMDDEAREGQERALEREMQWAERERLLQAREDAA